MRIIKSLLLLVGCAGLAAYGHQPIPCNCEWPTRDFRFQINLAFGHLRASRITGIAERASDCVASITASEGTVSIVEHPLHGGDRVVQADEAGAALHVDLTCPMDSIDLTVYSDEPNGLVTIEVQFRNPTNGSIYTRTWVGSGDQGITFSRHPEDVISCVIWDASIYEIDIDEHGH